MAESAHDAADRGDAGARTIVRAVIAERFGLPLSDLRPDHVEVARIAHVDLPVRAFTDATAAVIAVTPDRVALLDGLTLSAATMPQTMTAVARRLDGSRPFSGVSRTGTRIPAPQAHVDVVDAGDERLPAWVRGHFRGSAWVVLDADGAVASTAVLKDYDERVREIAVGTEERARGRGLARAVVRAAARAVIAGGRAVVYNHRIDNLASARVAEACGLHELGRYHAVAWTVQAAEPYGDDGPG